MLDISEDGFKMATFDKMEQGEEHFLKIALPSAKGEKEFISVKARVQWCNKEVDFELSTLGCYLVQVGVSERFSLATFIFNNLNKKTSLPHFKF